MSSLSKKILILFLLLTLVFLAGFTPITKPLYYKIYPVVNILVNGKEVVSEDVPAFQIDGRTMVPIRLISEALKADVKWDEGTRTVIINKEEPVIPAVVKEDLIDIKDITFNTTLSKIICNVTNNNSEDVTLKITINCYGRNGDYLGHVHISVVGLESQETKFCQVESEDKLKATTKFTAVIDSIKAH